MTTNTQTNEQPAGERAELTPERLAEAVPSTATILELEDGTRKTCMTYAELKQFAAALLEADAQRPTGCRRIDTGRCDCTAYCGTFLGLPKTTASHAQLPALMPLTEGQIWSLIEYNRAGSLGLARLIERAHGIKEQA